ncbi:putative C-type lectin domain family 20 member A isoform X1 [Clinocottus analis]|uniref:putative C-type lectin domain family 20 member A isoform X1 n=1 Tax=Clinocottus analis TaxID=304258 RepID=UPI0035C04238
MTEAQQHCRENYMDLATIRDPQDLETLNATLSSSKMAASVSRVWIGLHMDSWKWSLTNSSFYKPGEMEFRGWSLGQPNNYEGEEFCAAMYNDGTWLDYGCSDNFRPICFDVKGPNETFVFISTYMNWTEAQSYCREHHTDLAIVRNLEENLKVQKLIPTVEFVWIGLFRDGWKWSDGSDSSFRNWKSNEPVGFSEDCVSADFSAGGRWEILKCDVMSAFICYRDVEPVAMRVVKVRLQKSSSSVDLNDPVVMEGLLKQLKQKLKDQGHDDDIKLSWKKQADGKVFHKEEKKSRKKGRDEL